MTIEAWVRPDRARKRCLAHRDHEGVHGQPLVRALRGRHRRHQGSRSRDLQRRLPDDEATAALALNTWTHIATTFDGTALKLFVNGAQASQLLFTGAITTSTGALRIGGNNVWGDGFPGRDRRSPRSTTAPAPRPRSRPT